MLSEPPAAGPRGPPCGSRRASGAQSGSSSPGLCPHPKGGCTRELSPANIPPQQIPESATRPTGGGHQGVRELMGPSQRCERVTNYSREERNPVVGRAAILGTPAHRGPAEERKETDKESEGSCLFLVPPVSRQPLPAEPSQTPAAGGRAAPHTARGGLCMRAGRMTCPRRCVLILEGEQTLLAAHYL